MVGDMPEFAVIKPQLTRGFTPDGHQPGTPTAKKY